MVETFVSPCVGLRRRSWRESPPVVKYRQFKEECEQPQCVGRSVDGEDLFLWGQSSGVGYFFRRRDNVIIVVDSGPVDPGRGDDIGCVGEYDVVNCILCGDDGPMARENDKCPKWHKEI